MEIHHINYRDLLRSELLSRCKKNPSYSARSFSRDIGVSPGFLTQLFKSKKRLNADRAFRIAQALKWPDERSRLFTTLVRYEATKEAAMKKNILDEFNAFTEQSGGSQSFQDMSLDVFSLISDWYHFSILELAKIRGFSPDTKWIASKLGISKVEVDDALSRLIRLGLIKEDRDGQWTCHLANYSTGDIPNQALVNFHHGILDKAKTALVEQKTEERNFSSIAMSIDPKRLPKASDMIRNFRRELMTYLEGGDKEQVYQLSVQLFRIDKDLKEKAVKGASYE